MMNRILIVGATSAIAEACARNFAQDGARLFLTGRNHDSLSNIAQDLRIRGASEVICDEYEASSFETHHDLIERAWRALDGIDIALIAHGTLPDQAECEQSFEVARREIEVNAFGTISILSELAIRFEARSKGGVIAVITSVAGDRGRQSNYVYGAAKACVNTYLEGLRHRLFKSSVRVLTIKPGFVDTPMTKSFPKTFLWANPERVASDIYRSIKHRRNNTLYTPWFWRWIMLAIRLLPTRIFVRTNL